ncbi:MAG TPA: hypothetical protein VHO29_15820 [Marmoricola sp.]|nr:hypothetical protein [Marmoricola sp.]
MIKKAWLLLLPLVGGLLALGVAPSQASGTVWSITGVNSFGCTSSAWDIGVQWSGTDGGVYQHHTTVESGGLVYMNEGFDATRSDGTDTWGLYTSSTYGPTTGTYPIPAGQPMKVTIALERPKGTVVSSWTMVAASCDAGTLLYNGPTSADVDGDYVATPTDQCPALQAFTANGCLVRDRAMTLKAKHGPRRVVGMLSSPGYPALSAGRTVTIWKVRPGPDRAVRTRVTNSLGKFKARVGKGRYYATSPDFIDPASGQVLADTSRRVRVR